MNDPVPAIKPTILLVEDREDDVFFLRRALSRVGAHVDVRVVSNGAEAQAYMTGEPPFTDRSYYPLPSLIVCDFKMPRRGGVDFLRWLRARREFESLPFVLLSGSVLPHEKEIALDLGADLYLRKTADFGQMMEYARLILHCLHQEKSARGEHHTRANLPKGRLVLVIDDEANVQRMIADILSPFGFEVMPADNSTDGLACAELHRPDVVLCDVVLPDALGFQTARALKERPATRDVPIILITGYSYMRDLEPSSKWQFLMKPFTAHGLIEAVMHVLPAARAA